MDDSERLELGRVIDHALIDRDGRRAGRVDDLELEVISEGAQVPRIVLRGLVSGPLPRPTGRLAAALARCCYRMIGVRDPHPVTLAWSHVRAIDAMVHLDVERHEADLQVVDHACARLLQHLPGSAAP